MSTLERQQELEQEMGSLGISRYFRKLDRNGLVGVTTGQTLLENSLLPLVESIKLFTASTKKGNAGIYGSVAKYIDLIGVEETAFLSLRKVVNSLAKGERMTTIAESIALSLEDELNHRQLADVNPLLMKRVLENLKTVSDPKFRRKTLKRAAVQSSGLEHIELPTEVRLKVGIKLLELIKGLGFIEFKTITEGKNKTVKYVEATEELHQWLDTQNTACSMRSPVYLPMIVPPKDWTTPYSGGYLHTKITMMKVRNKEYLEELSHQDIPMVYASLNALQATPWAINKPVYNVMKSLWETTGGGIAKLPLKDGKPLPNKPYDIATNEEARKEWSQKASATHKENFRDKSKRIAVGQKLWLAEKFLDEEAIYFPHSLDWRGRAYAIPGFVNPQADDTGKALLRFATGKALGSEGVAWLAIHLANTYGYDKADFDERIEWAEANTGAILDSAMKPLDGERFWLQADKPFQFFAACFEWLGYTMQGEDYVSYLPVGMDGSCNGLQNFSGMLRDSVGGTYTNLVPSKKPSDIYAKVASIVHAQVELDAKAGKSEAIGWLTAEYLEDGQWVNKPIGRKLTKRNTMTRPYSVTHYGMRDQLFAEVDAMVKEGSIRFLNKSTNAVSGYCHYLADLNSKAIRQVVVAAEEAMDWLRQVAKVVATNGLPVVWKTPSGLPVRQMYVTSISESVQVRVDGLLTRLQYNKDGTELNTRKQQAGISPNFVHGCDAAHLVRTIVLCKEAGITNFSMIHDSYGTHACDTGLMGQLLRKAFVEQYRGDVLGTFRQEIVDQLIASGAPELAAELPPVPKFGTLDIEDVMNSEYFFA